MTARSVYETLRRKGGPVLVTIQTAGEYDPETSSAPSSETTYEGRATIFEYGLIGSGRQAAPASDVLQGDKQMLLAALQDNGEPMPEPLPETTRVAAPDGRVYVVRNVKTLAPDGVAQMYELHLTAG